MKTIGILCGLGPESTIDYYKGIIKSFNNNSSDLKYPEIILISLDMNKFLEILNLGNMKILADWLIEKIKVLHIAGADFAVIASNTPHIVFNDIIKQVPIPILSIVEEACLKAIQRKFRKPLLLGTKYILQSDIYDKVFNNKDISIIKPDEKAQNYINDKIFSEIELGIIKETTKENFLRIIDYNIDKHGIDSVILGCTELPLIIKKSDLSVPILNTTEIHIESIVRYCIT